MEKPITFERLREIEEDAYEAVKEAEEWLSRKAQARVIRENTQYPSVAFAMLDGKDWQEIAWRIARAKQV